MRRELAAPSATIPRKPKRCCRSSAGGVLEVLGGRNGAKSDRGNWRRFSGTTPMSIFAPTARPITSARWPQPARPNTRCHVCYVALRPPFGNPHPPSYESGGATDNVLDIWKAAAPAIDILCPDIYMPDSASYVAVMDHLFAARQRLVYPGNPRNRRRFPHVLAAIGTEPSVGRLSALLHARNAGINRAAGMNYRMLEPIMREVAELNSRAKSKRFKRSRGKAP